MDFINFSQITGNLVKEATIQVTGDLFITLYFIFFILLFIGVGVLSIPLDIMFFILMPPIIVASAFVVEVYILLAMIIFYVSVLLARLFFN